MQEPLKSLLDKLSETYKFSQKQYNAYIKEIIDAGGANATDEHGITALMKVAEDGPVLSAKRLIKAGANVNARDCDGFTVLMRTAGRNSVAMIKLLIDAGADINAVTTIEYPDNSIIHWTALKTHVDQYETSKAIRTLLGEVG